MDVPCSIQDLEALLQSINGASPTPLKGTHRRIVDLLREEGRSLNRQQIASGLGLVNSPSLRNQINHLVQKKMIDVDHERRPFLYRYKV